MSSVAYVACDAAVALHRTCREQASRGNLVLATSIIASSLAFIDGSVATVALPAIGRALNGDAATLQWIVNIYLLPLTAFLLAGGDLGDRFGSGRVLAWGVGLFTIASIACAVAPNLGVLLASRAAQGVAAAIFLPNSLAVLGAAFPEESRARAVGIWAGTTALAGAFGPVLGGALVDRVGWRSIFLLNLPFGILALVMALRYAPPRIEAPERAIDLAGMAIAVLALGALSWAVTEASGPMGWTDRAMMSAFAGALLLPMFVRLEKRRGERAMLPMSLFRSRAFSGLSVFTVLLYGVWSGLAVLLP
ncbi:MAG: Drug resistance transporter EmrB/QacA subfamily [Hyphomicrobiales bacterium]|nr:Drug resistance transporter EmrB/QacA subfamily [Hyphomicrobiales bacterium]